MRIDRSTPKVPKHALPSTNQPGHRPASDSYNPSSQYALKQPDSVSQYRTDSLPRQQSYSSQIPQPHAPYSNPPLQQQQQQQLPQYAAAAATVASRPREGEYSTPTIDVKLDTSVCYAFQRGQCKYGDKCMYSHDLSKLGPTFDNRVHGYNAPKDTQYPSVAAASLQDEYIPEGLSYVARLSTYGAGSVYGGGAGGSGGGESVYNTAPPSTHTPDRGLYSAQQGRDDSQQGARASAYDARPSGPQSYQPPVPQQYQPAHTVDQGYSSRPSYSSSDHQQVPRDRDRRDAPAPSRYDPTPSHQQQPSQQPMSKYGPSTGSSDRSYSSHQPPRSDSSSYNSRSAPSDSRDSSSRYGPGGGGESSRGSGDRDRSSSGSGYHNPPQSSANSSNGARPAPGMSKYSAPNYAQY